VKQNDNAIALIVDVNRISLIAGNGSGRRCAPGIEDIRLAEVGPQRGKFLATVGAVGDMRQQPIRIRIRATLIDQAEQNIRFGTIR
jgi:hypothetical protein